ncbi:hypothetical protein ONZ45_g4060 [Pleurotus djamor]|nr:hypothetical protein ONZ45_g4060 [Pleurotus djamor]
MSKDVKGDSSSEFISQQISSSSYSDTPAVAKKPWWHSVKEPGSATQIVIAAVLAIAIGMAVTTTVDKVPEAATVLLAIPGRLWLRALRAVVLPLIMVAMILAMQSLKESTTGKGAKLAKWTVGFYVLTAIFSTTHSLIISDLVWRRLMTQVGAESLQVSDADQALFEERSQTKVHDVVQNMFDSFVPQNIINALATDSLLSVLVISVLLGCLVKPGSAIVKVARELEIIITTVITFLIKCAPIGVFFLILPNLFRLDIAEIGRNLGVLIGGAIGGMAIHLFIFLPLMYFVFLRKNPYPYWFSNSSAWITAWGSASSAATMPVTLRCLRKHKFPNTVIDFAVPLGTLVNMDGSAIYFPMSVIFLAATQGIRLNPAEYTIIVLLSTLCSIGTTPIPSSSLVLTIMIASAVNVPVTGMYAVIVAIDWFIDRFRTMVNVSGDLFIVPILVKVTGIVDPVDEVSPSEEREISEKLAESSGAQRV